MDNLIPVGGGTVIRFADIQISCLVMVIQVCCLARGGFLLCLGKWIFAAVLNLSVTVFLFHIRIIEGDTLEFFFLPLSLLVRNYRKYSKNI